MSKIKCIIIEDEPLAVKVLSDYIAQAGFLELQGSFKDAILATDWLRLHSTELIFLDIHLPKLKGMSFLKTLVHPPAVIITTAYHEYAVESFNLSVTDYLLKPFDFERFLVAVNKVKTTAAQTPAPSQGAELKDHIFLQAERKKVKVLFSEILFIESQREYIKVVTTRKEYVSKLSTREIENMLPEHLFRRVHRSYIVSVGKIDSYTADSVEVTGITIPIGRGYRHVIEDL